MRSSAGSIINLGDGRWRIIVSNGYSPVTGKRQRLTKVVRGTKRTAEFERSKMLLQAGSGAVAEGVSVSELVTLYLEHVQTKVKLPTYTEYERLCSYIQTSQFSKLQAKDLYKHENRVREWLAGFDAVNTRVAEYKQLRQVMNWAKRKHIIEINVCDFIDVPKTERKEIATVTLEDLPRYLQAVRDTEIEAGVLLMLYCGLRRSEAVARRWEDVEFMEDIARITVNTSIRELKGGGVDIGECKTEKSRRIVIAPPDCANRLKEIKQGVWICEFNCDVMRPNYFGKRWREIVKSCDLPYIPIKNLRHSCGTMLIRELGASVADVAELLGHTTMKTTEAYYLQASEVSKLRVAEMWQKGR